MYKSFLAHYLSVFGHVSDSFPLFSPSSFAYNEVRLSVVMSPFQYSNLLVQHLGFFVENNSKTSLCCKIAKMFSRPDSLQPPHLLSSLSNSGVRVNECKRTPTTETRIRKGRRSALYTLPSIILTHPLTGVEYFDKDVIFNKSSIAGHDDVRCHINVNLCYFMFVAGAELCFIQGLNRLSVNTRPPRPDLYIFCCWRRGYLRTH